MNAQMALTLMVDSQYSTVPKSATDRLLMAKMRSPAASAEIHTGNAGSQKVMYVPMAIASPPIATTWQAQYV